MARATGVHISGVAAVIAKIRDIHNTKFMIPFAQGSTETMCVVVVQALLLLHRWVYAATVRSIHIFCMLYFCCPDCYLTSSPDVIPCG